MTMPIIHHAGQRPYQAISKATLSDNRLSFEARGLLAYLLSKPDNWVLRMTNLRHEGNCGADRIRRILKELEDHGYLARKRPQDAKGRMTGEVLEVYETPENPDSGKTRTPVFTDAGKHPPLENTEKTENTERTGNTEEPSEGDKSPSSGGTRAKRRAPLTDCPFEEAVPEEWVQEAVKKYGNGVDWAAEGELFVNHHLAKGSQFRDWRRAWWTWCRQPFKKHEIVHEPTPWDGGL